MIRMLFGLKSIPEIVHSGVKLINWLEIAQVTIANRYGRDGFLRDGTAEEMAQAAADVIAQGGNMGQAIDAIEAAYMSNCIYSTPQEHPCDEWHPSDILRSAA